MAQSETVLYNFDATQTDAQKPVAGLLLDSQGNLFSASFGGGSKGFCDDPIGPIECGTVYELSPGSNAPTILYNFVGAPADGAEPNGEVIMDSAGNLYGTTIFGGNDCLITDCGLVFQLEKTSSGYTEHILHYFNGPEGANPLAGLVMDSAGNLYGMANGGGVYTKGLVFELQNFRGQYSYQILYSFGPTFADGADPVAGVILDPSGNLYGTTSLGGDLTVCGGGGCGTVFELVKSETGYSHQILHSFHGNDGIEPGSDLLMDAAGNLYGTTESGGALGCGTVFELVNSSGSYTEKTLYSFGCAANQDGQQPTGAPIMDAAGNLYGTTWLGGKGCGTQGCGTAFELTNVAGVWTERILHLFGTPPDGISVHAPLVMDGSGFLYGTTVAGGFYQGGTAYKIDPRPSGPVKGFSALGVTFGNQPLLTPAASQTVVISNSGNGNLVFNSAAATISGTNASDFSIAGNTCSGVTLSPGTACMLTVAFTPSLLATESATLSVSDNTTSGSQMVGLSGTGIPPAILTPSRLTFIQLVNTTSAAQAVTLKNTGVLPTTINSIGITGATNFAQTNDCGPNLAPGASCTINVVITPTDIGPYTGDLTVQETTNGTTGVQSAYLFGGGEDFRLLPPANTSATVTAGQSATYMLQVDTLSGFNGTATFSCTGAPAEATCMVTPSSVSVSTNPTYVAVTVSTTKPASAVGRISPSEPPITGNNPVWIEALLCLSVFAMFWSGRKRLPCRAVCRFAGGLFLTVALATCGGGGGTPVTGGGPTKDQGTPPGSYTLTVTAKATSGSGSFSESAKLTLIVSQ